MNAGPAHRPLLGRHEGQPPAGLVSPPVEQGRAIANRQDIVIVELRPQGVQPAGDHGTGRQALLGPVELVDLKRIGAHEGGFQSGFGHVNLVVLG